MTKVTIIYIRHDSALWQFGWMSTMRFLLLGLAGLICACAGNQRPRSHVVHGGPGCVSLFSSSRPSQAWLCEGSCRVPKGRKRKQAPTWRHFPRPCLPHFANIPLTKTEPPQLQGIERETILLDGRGRICG